MGHVGPLKDAILAAAVLSWAALGASLLGVGRFRLSGYGEHAAAFLVAAALTRLAFTHVETRWQIAAFASLAAVYALAQARWVGGEEAGGRWAASMVGIVLGAVATREVVHHVLERWLG